MRVGIKDLQEGNQDTKQGNFDFAAGLADGFGRDFHAEVRHRNA